MSRSFSDRLTFLAASFALAALASAGCAAEPIGEAEADPADLDDEVGADVDGSPAGVASPFDFQPIAPCRSEQDYVHRAVVRFGLGRRPFTPPCVRLASGGTVVFQGSLREHPIEPRPSGTAPSPIQATDEGGSVEFEFTSYGFFPYRCARHPEETGVIWTSWQ
jgi:plastocyanin